MLSMKKITKCFGNILNRKDNINNDIDLLNNELEFVEIKYLSTVIPLDSNIKVNFEDLKDIIENNDMKNIAKMAEEKIDVKSRYLFGKEENLFNIHLNK